MTPPPDTARLLGWLPTVIRWSGLTYDERRFCIGMRANEKRNPGFVPSPGAVRWMQKLVARFQAETLKDDPIIETEDPAP
jgi:hypothetical protein